MVLTVALQAAREGCEWWPHQGGADAKLGPRRRGAYGRLITNPDRLGGNGGGQALREHTMNRCEDLVRDAAHRSRHRSRQCLICGDLWLATMKDSGVTRRDSTGDW